MATSEGQASMQASNDPGHDPVEAFPPAPPRAYDIAAVVLMVLSSPMLCLGCLVVVLFLVVLGCLVVFLPLLPPPGAPPPTISTDSTDSTDSKSRYIKSVY